MIIVSKMLFRLDRSILILHEVLTSDYAMLLADELGYNPIIDDDAAFDLHAP